VNHTLYHSRCIYKLCNDTQTVEAYVFHVCQLLYHTKSQTSSPFLP